MYGRVEQRGHTIIKTTVGGNVTKELAILENVILFANLDST